MSLPANLPSISKAKLPEQYQAARIAISESAKIDECKQWADQAEALASYAKQADDDHLRKMADRIQARAIRRCGELLRKIKAGVNQHKSARGGVPPSRSQAAKNAGMSRDQKRTALRVARVPGDDFDAAVESDSPPTVTALAEAGKLPGPTFDLKGRKPEEFKQATKALGIVRDLREFSQQCTPAVVFRGSMDSERKALLRNAKAGYKWLGKLIDRLEV